MTREEKTKRLQIIADEISNCTECKKGKSGLPVPGEGNPDADIVFLGEAPGKMEALTGRPFVGRSGSLLRSLIHQAGLREEDVYITSPVKYLPDRGTPTRADILHASTHLLKQLAVIDPSIIVLLGATATVSMLGEHIPILKAHGKIIQKNSRSYLITLHPAAVLRFAKLKPLMEKDFELLHQMCKKSV